jgi:hypothetical protein
MNREHILDEIRRTAKANGGRPLGYAKFGQETGIKHHDWFGKYWARWGDAVREAGFAPNVMQGALSEGLLLEKLTYLIRELGRFPSNGDLRLKKRSDPTFPNEKVFDGHFGSRASLRQAVIEYCRAHPGLDDIPALCGPPVSNLVEEASKQEKLEAEPR